MIKSIASSSAGNAFLFDDLLLDCGVHIDKIRANCSLTDLEGCLISHSHSDHSIATENLLRAGVNVYCSRGTAKSLGIADHHRVNTVEELEQFYVGDWRVKSFRTAHEAEDPRGFLFQREPAKGVYLTDSCYSRYTFNRLTHILIEANYAKDILEENLKEGSISYPRKKRVIESHFSLRDVKEFLKGIGKSRLREVWLLHLSDDNSDEERFKEEVQEIVGVPVKVAGK